MLKTNFTHMPVAKWAFFCLLSFFLGINEIEAQALACNNAVQVSVDSTPNACQAVITSDMILEGTPTPGHDYEIKINLGLQVIATGINQVVVSNASQYFGYNLTVTIKDLTSGNSCWGSMTFEDKLPPVITCPDVTVNCSDDLNIVGTPTAIDNCDPAPYVQLTGENVNANSLCANGYATITRNYIAVDDEGNTSPACTQTIYVQRPAVVDFPNDIMWTCEQYDAYPEIVNATRLHPYIADTDLSTPNVINVNLNPACDDNDAPQLDNENINSTNLANGGIGCPGQGLDDADVLDLTGSGIVANVVGQHCNYQQSHSDQVLQTCGVTFKIIRTWTVIDWCTGSVVTSGANGEDNVQVIKVVDEVAPLIQRAPFSVSANVTGQHPQVCRSQSFLLAPTVVSDNCNTVTVKIFTPVGEAVYTNGGGVNGGLIPAPGLPQGVHNVVYQATDACGNQTSLNVQVTVIDDIAPIAICDEITDVNLGNDGKAVVPASVFDDGSYDNCCLEGYEARRMDDPCDDGHDDTVFGPSVVFCCEDIDNGPVTVVFRAVDCYGNTNECMVTVNLSDKIAPTLVNCPANQRILCEWYADNLETQLANAADEAAQCDILTSHFGQASFYDNCNVNVDCDVTINIDQCLEGFIRRTWSATDSGTPPNPSTSNCTQTIFVDHVSDWVVEFPADITVDCGTTVPSFGEPEIFFETCELVAVSYEDVFYNTVPDACYKIVRKWNIINWCVVGENIDQEVVEKSEFALWTVNGGTLPGPTGPEPNCDLDNDGDCDRMTFRDSWNNNSQPAAANATDTFGPDTDDDSDPWDGYIAYDQVIKVIDEVDPVFADNCILPDVCITGNTCGVNLVLPAPDIDDCSPDINLSAQINFGAGWMNGFGPYANIPAGTYDVRYTAVDNCNNQSVCETTVTVVDCKKPTPYCKNGLIIELMVPVDPNDEAMVEVWASDLNAGSFDNCPGALKFSFSADISDDSRVYTCDDVGQVPVEIWVTDAAGNQDFCETFLIIQANMGQCGTDPLVSSGGMIADEADQTVSDVSVSLSGQSTGTAMTDNNGMYNFTGITPGDDITITPEKNDDPVNGVTTFDLVLISKHILGTQILASPYKLIAADANNSGSITTYDLVELRKLILQIIPAFTANDSWRFIDKDYVFPDPANPWSEIFPEVVNFNNIGVSVSDADFVAVKVGDVNGSAVTNFAAGSDERTINGVFQIEVEDRLLKAGETVTVTFTAKEMAVLGYQFTLNFDRSSLELVELLPGLAKEEHFGFTLLEEGALTTSWNGEFSNEQLFSLTFKALENGRLSEMLRVNSRFTPAEAYNQESELMDVALTFNGKAASGFELYQNIPNPFNGQTTIGFTLPEDGRVKLTVSDISGKQLMVVEKEMTSGYNEIMINSNGLPSSGVLYYTLETAGETATGKMIVVD